MQILNDIDKLYEITPSHHKTMKGGYICPICNNPYVTEDGFVKHLAKKDCYDIKALVKGTSLEDTAYKWYVEVKESESGRAVYNINTFRKDRLFASYIKTVIYCIQNDETRFMKYLAYMMLVKNYKTVGGAMKAMLKVVHLREYRLYLQKVNDIEDDAFIERYHDDLIDDQQFLVRSLEKAHLSIHTFMEVGMTMLLEDMPIDYKDRIMAIVDHVKGG